MNAKNVLMLLAVLFISVTACTNQKEAKSETEGTTAEVVVDGHNAQNALDWNGAYKGVLPCASCEGIETTLVLNEDLTFDKTEVYLGEEDGTFNTKGNFKWKEDGTTIALQTEDGEQLYKVTEGSIIALNADGKENTGDLAKFYVMNKVN